MKRFFLLLLTLFLFIGCDAPALSGNVKKSYFTNGQLRSKFIMSDKSGKNGILEKYGYDGKMTSSVKIQNGVKVGIERWYDAKGRIIREVPYQNGEKHGLQKDFYPNGDIMASIEFRHNIANGKATTYRQDGKIYKQVTFRDGKIIR